MKTIGTINKRIYQAVDGKQFSDRDECLVYERKIKIVSNIKESLATVFENSEDVYESLVDGLLRMTITDRKTVLNGLLNITVGRNKPIRKSMRK